MISCTQVCFGTLALGEKYCYLALQLAKDLEKFSFYPLIVLTDRPEIFKNQPNVQVFKHRQQSIGIYHDKQYVIQKALERYDTCVYIDADMRILSPVPPIKCQPGITARSCTNLVRHYCKIVKDVENNAALSTIEKIAQKLDIDLKNVKFVSEFLFAVHKDLGQELEFLDLWNKIGQYLELQGIQAGEGSSIGLAAAKAGIEIRHDDMPGIDFFNDKIERFRIKKKEVDPNARQQYFEEYRQIAFPKRSIAKKVSDKLNKLIYRFYCSVRLRLITLSNFDFYYR